MARFSNLIYALFAVVTLVGVAAEESWDFVLEHSLDGGQNFQKRNAFRFVLVDADRFVPNQHHLHIHASYFYCVFFLMFFVGQVWHACF